LGDGREDEATRFAKQGLSTEQVPVSASGGSLKNLKDIRSRKVACKYGGWYEVFPATDSDSQLADPIGLGLRVVRKWTKAEAHRAGVFDLGIGARV